MMLKFPDGRSFAVGAARYAYEPSDVHGGNHRIFCNVRFAGLSTEAALDTGGIYFICRPELAREISPQAEGSERILIRGEWITGSLERHDLTFVADQGEDLTIQALFFIPNEGEDDIWPTGAPSFFGMQGCLEHIRFAIDPGPEEQFYFGTYE